MQPELRLQATSTVWGNAHLHAAATHIWAHSCIWGALIASAFLRSQQSVTSCASAVFSGAASRVAVGGVCTRTVYRTALRSVDLAYSCVCVACWGCVMCAVLSTVQPPQASGTTAESCPFNYLLHWVLNPDPPAAKIQFQAASLLCC